MLPVDVGTVKGECVCVCAVYSVCVCVRYNAMAPMFCSPNPLMTLKKP